MTRKNQRKTWVEQGKGGKSPRAPKDFIAIGGDPHVPKRSNKLTVHQFRACAPLSIRKNITKEMVQLINADIDKSDVKEEFREHLLTWVDVMQEGKWKVRDYISACKFMTHKLMGDTQQSAWVKTFPDRFQAMVDKGMSDKSIASRVSLYNSNPLVQKIAARTLPSLHVLNSDILQEAINVSAELMRSAKSETVRQKSAATLIEHLKPPEALKVDISVGVSNDTVEDLREITRGLAVQQQKMIKSGGMSAGQIASMDVVKKIDEEIIEAEYNEMELEPIPQKNPLKDFFPKGKT